MEKQEKKLPPLKVRLSDKKSLSGAGNEDSSHQLQDSQFNPNKIDSNNQDIIIGQQVTQQKKTQMKSSKDQEEGGEFRNNKIGQDMEEVHPLKRGFTKQELEAIERAKLPYGKFKISKNKLIEIVGACQDRNFSEEVDFMEQQGGAQWLVDGLLTHPKSGIVADQADLNERDMAFGNNRKQVVKPKTFMELLLEALTDFTLKILMFAAIISIIIEEAAAENSSDRKTAWIEGFAILVAVFVCSTVTATNNYQKERQFQKLNREAEDRKLMNVMRSGGLQILNIDNVMVGDIIILQEGQEIPADGFVLEATELTTDESAMTGETDPVKKGSLDQCIETRNRLIAEGSKNTAGRHSVPSCVILSGTKILTGEGKMVIMVVGDSSSVGKIKALLRQKEDTETPLQAKLKIIAENIGNFGLISAILIVAILLLRLAIERIQAKEWERDNWGDLVEFLLIGITVLVVAIPEGLPLSVTLSLAFSVKKMLKDQNLVRKIEACETMGGANMICSDKTGTLTMNVMTLTTWYNDELQSLDPHDQKINLDKYMIKEFQEQFLIACSCNSSASTNPESGSKTEIAILKFVDKSSFDYKQYREKFLATQFFKSTFNSAKKRMSVGVQLDNGTKRIFVKGASEIILKSCVKYHSKTTGQISMLDAQKKQEIEAAIKQMADDALRTIGLAYVDMQGGEDLATTDKLGVFDIETKNLTFMGILGIADIIRPEVPLAVAQCKKAGIKVRMVTGDNKDTARAIAIKCGLIEKDNIQEFTIMEGPDFISRVGGVVCLKCMIGDCNCPRDKEAAKEKGMEQRIDTIKNEDEFEKIYPQLCVMARSRPEDKYALVTGLKERDHVVAVTGDGTNDAPALKKADVGFAMGKSGTQVARDASSIILLDDNFKSIVSAVLWGRNIYDSIKKFLQFQLTVNIVAVFCTLVGAVVIKQEIFTPIQMLWINLIMDTLASLALATEPPQLILLNRQPHNRNEYMISKKMIKHIIGQSLLQITIIIIIIFAGEYFLPEYSDDFDQKIVDKYAGFTAKINDNKLMLKYYYPAYKIKYHNSDMNTIRSGRLRSYNGKDKDYYEIKDYYDQPSRHFTYCFNIFVMLQLFNFLNARKLEDEFNILSNITKNWFFPMIVFSVFWLQVLIIQVGYLPFSIYQHGLTAKQWLICIGFGAASIFWSFVLKCVPEKNLIKFNLGWYTGTQNGRKITNANRMEILSPQKNNQKKNEENSDKKPNDNDDDIEQQPINKKQKTKK